VSGRAIRLWWDCVALLTMMHCSAAASAASASSREWAAVDGRATAAFFAAAPGVTGAPLPTGLTPAKGKAYTAPAAETSPAAALVEVRPVIRWVVGSPAGNSPLCSLSLPSLSGTALPWRQARTSPRRMRPPTEASFCPPQQRACLLPLQTQSRCACSPHCHPPSRSHRFCRRPLSPSLLQQRAREQQAGVCQAPAPLAPAQQP
jgi:hypothetical protein